MRKAGWILVCGLTLGIAPAQSSETISISLGMGITGPGEEASVPVTVSIAGTSHVKRIWFEIMLPKELISFNSATKRLANGSLGLSIETELTEKEKGNLLQVKVSSSDLIPQGDLLDLKFSVSNETHANDEFDLKILGQEAQTSAGNVVEVTGVDGLIVVAVLGDFIPACFFYMH